jgi:hypothetical protein
MAVTATASNHFKYSLAKKLVDLSADTIKVLLMRSGFVFNKDNHATLINITAAFSSTTISITAGLSLADSSNSFLTAGFVPGNQIVTTGFSNAGNNATKIISTVTASLIAVTNSTAMVAESAGSSFTITSDDELATGSGYTQDTKTTGTVTLDENDSSDYLNATFPTVVWTAAGGSIGPTPGAIVYSDTSSDNTIIGYIDFGAEETATDTTTFNIASGTIRIA